MTNTTDYTRTETVPASALQVGDTVLDPRHPNHPYKVTRLATHNPNARVQVRGLGAHPAGWIQVTAASVYARAGVTAGALGVYAPTAEFQRVLPQ